MVLRGFSESRRLRDELYPNPRAMDILHDISKVFENFIFRESKIFPKGQLDFDQKELLCVYLETMYRGVRIVKQNQR